MIISAIASVSLNNAIGRAGALPWPKLADDLRWFASKTIHSVVIMGSRTWMSLPVQPLPRRYNVVLTRGDSGPYALNSFDYAVSLTPDHALAVARKMTTTDEVFVIGGAQIYALFADQIDRVYLTHLDIEVDDADTFFPIDVKTDDWRWPVTARPKAMDERSWIAMEFLRYDRVRNERSSA